MGYYITAASMLGNHLKFANAVTNKLIYQAQALFNANSSTVGTI